MRHISKSIVLFALAIALVAITAPAQDLEPTLTRAAARVAERLVDQHPGYGDGVEALATVPTLPQVFFSLEQITLKF